VSSKIRSARWLALRVTPRTCWSFVELEDETGRRGAGEATLAGHEAAMARIFERELEALRGREVAKIDLGPVRSAAGSRAEFAVVSAFDQALHDLRAQAAGVSVARALRGRCRESIPVYANINRGISRRTPDGFAEQAARAVAEGFRAVKIAPFDEIELYGDPHKRPDAQAIDAGLARIAAVRAVVGSDVDLMVDCHWRFNPAAAETIVQATEPYGLYWLECPLPETPEMLEALRVLRAQLNRRGVRMAGCEEMSLVRGFLPFLEAGAYDVIMPDVKYVGGMQEMLAVADTLARYGVGFSPHNPSGPVCHAASLQICSTSSDLERLELQYAETPLFDALVGYSLPAAARGRVAVPDAPGLGVRLEAELTRRLRVDAS